VEGRSHVVLEKGSLDQRVRPQMGILSDLNPQRKGTSGPSKMNPYELTKELRVTHRQKEKGAWACSISAVLVAGNSRARAYDKVEEHMVLKEGVSRKKKKKRRDAPNALFLLLGRQGTTFGGGGGEIGSEKERSH